jgi:hypothetical protein
MIIQSFRRKCMNGEGKHFPSTEKAQVSVNQLLHAK